MSCTLSRFNEMKWKAWAQNMQTGKASLDSLVCILTSDASPQTQSALKPPPSLQAQTGLCKPTGIHLHILHMWYLLLAFHSQGMQHLSCNTCLEAIYIVCFTKILIVFILIFCSLLLKLYFKMVCISRQQISSTVYQYIKGTSSIHPQCLSLDLDWSGQSSTDGVY